MISTFLNLQTCIVYYTGTEHVVIKYQFNFKFSLGDDIYAQDSIDLLTRSGIDFQRHEQHGWTAVALPLALRVAQSLRH